MYTRAYNDERHGIVIPESYGGTALFDNPIEEAAAEQDKKEAEVSKNPWEEVHNEPQKKAENEATASAFSRLPFGDFFINIFKNSNVGLQKIGIEEILIIATAAFLFFSKEGDRECAIMLILLLFLA